MATMIWGATRATGRFLRFVLGDAYLSSRTESFWEEGCRIF